MISLSTILPSKESLKAGTKYFLIGASVFAFGMVWNFPYEKIRDHLTGTLTRQTGYRIDMETLSPALPIGFVAKNARIQAPPRGMGEPMELKLSRMRVTISPFAPLTYLFKKSVSLSYSVEQDKARFTGGVSLGKEETGFDLETKGWKVDHGIPMDVVNPMMAGSELKIVGSVTIDAELDGKSIPLQQGDLSNASGKLKITAANTTLTPPLLGELRFDKIVLDGVLDKGKLNVKSIALTGPDMNGTANGMITVAPVFGNSQCNLDVKLTISEKKEQLKGLISTFGSQFNLRLNEQGQMAFRVNGLLNQPNIVPY
jgi:type II secretion system protein N